MVHDTGSKALIPKLVTLHNKYNSIRTTSNSQAISTDLMPVVLSFVLDVIHRVNREIEDSAEVLITQHGVALKHESIYDLMSKLGRAVDVATTQSLHEQLGAIHAAQLVSRNRTSA